MDMSVYHFKCKAADFYNKLNENAQQNESEANRQKRIDNHQRDMDHLFMLQRTIEAHVLVQELKTYQEENEQKTEHELLQEGHHPTKKLARYLTAAGEPKPTTFHEPHHIVPGKGLYRQRNMMTVRLNLHAHGIGINDPCNGVWLTNFLKNKPEDWATPEAPPHRKLHGFNYETWIFTKLRNSHLPAHIFLGILKDIKRQLKDGTHPAKIVEKKDANWTGR